MPAYDADLFLPPAPVARVTIRNPQTGQAISDIALLIDSGADVTLIPRSLTNQLGIAIDSAAGYELKSFDNRVSILHAVRLELVFLNRTFRGRFLVIDQDWGILGRDILNHVSIVLDGPNLEWREAR